MNRIISILFLFLSTIGLSQTWSNEVAPIFYNKCAQCHHTGGISSTPLTTYSEVSSVIYPINAYVTDDEMPPWPPNNNYQQYVHNRALSTTDKTTILDWIANGFQEGNSTNTPPPPVFNDGAILGAGDLVVKMPTYTSKALAGHDDYACFSIPSGLTSNRVIKSVEIIPGNRQIVHHALIYLDPTGNEVTDSTGGDCSSPALQTTKLIAGYTPGATPMTLPSVAPLKLGIQITAGSDIYFAMHYPAGSFGEQDSTKVIFHFYPNNETGIRQVYAAAIIENWNFTLPPDVITNVSGSYPPGNNGLTNEISVLSVFPHMHLLGKDIKSFAIKPNLDTVKFIDIPHWDFHWQDFYFFKHMPYLPIGTKVKGNGNYDNTTANLENPNNPPITVYPGLNTTDEMFLIYFHYMTHQAGDENYDMEALMTAEVNKLLKDKNANDISIYPNPSSNEFSINFEGKKGDKYSIIIYDTQGKIVSTIADKLIATNENITSTWDGNTAQGETAKKGLYFVSINLNGTFLSKRIIKN